MPGSPASRKSRPRPAKASSRPPTSSASSGARPTNAPRGVSAAGSAAAGSPAARSSPGSCWRIARWSSRSRSPGSMPSSSTSALRVLVGLERLRLAARAIEAEHQLARRRSRSGCSLTSASSCPTTSAWRPSASFASIARPGPPLAGPRDGRSRAARRARRRTRPAARRATATAPPRAPNGAFRALRGELLRPSPASRSKRCGSTAPDRPSARSRARA